MPAVGARLAPSCLGGPTRARASSCSVLGSNATPFLSSGRIDLSGLAAQAAARTPRRACPAEALRGGARVVASVASSSDTAGPSEDDGPPEEMNNPMTGAAHDNRYWHELLLKPDGVRTLERAGSASDAHMLRRKGHLKEQDGFIEFMIKMHRTHTSMEVMQKMERWVREHQQDPKRSSLKRMLPEIGKFYTHLPLVDALMEYDEFASLSRRRYVPPNFAEMRHILNIAQCHGSAGDLKLMTFDADGTLYADGAHIEQDSEMIDCLLSLMESGIDVGIVTAAGYPGEAHKFEGRMQGLLDAFRDRNIPKEVRDRFHIMGGECNYLLRVNEECRLEFVPDEEWMTPYMLSWQEEDIQAFLDEAQSVLLDTASRLRMDAQLLRKGRAVGLIPTTSTIYEVLEEITLACQFQLVEDKIPFCAFNGGNDVFVDVGNKSIGLYAMQKYLGVRPYQSVHTGDRFTVSGNDSATRSRCSILWVANPEETAFFIRLIMEDIRSKKDTPYIE